MGAAKKKRALRAVEQPPKPEIVSLSEAEAEEIKALDGSLIIQTLRIAELEVAYEEDRITRESLINVIREKTANVALYEQRKLNLGELVIRMHEKKEKLRQAVNEYKNIRATYQSRIEQIADGYGINRDTHKFAAPKLAFVPI